MKNIQILPTDKPSRLYLTKEGFYFLLPNIKGNDVNFQNVYITNDEEIKKGDYFYSLFQGEERILKYNKFVIPFPKDKKIILTTDQDLIADGVQAIDDEFLEWFVKNKSCEEVEVYDDENITDDGMNVYNIYKIIIPKEEIKQECECTNECLGYLTKECKRIEEPKQETLEEASERALKSGLFKDETLFIAGSKWFQDQLCNSEIIQRIKATKSDAEARRIIKSI